MQAIIAALAVAVFGIAAFGDIKNRRIPNWLVLAISVLGLARMALAGDLIGAGMTLLAAAAVLAIGFLLFWRGFIGGGDAKLVSGAALLVGYHDLFGFLFLMSLCGGVLALALMAERRFHAWFEAFVLWVGARQTPGGWIMRHPRAAAALAAVSDRGRPALQLSVPYGVAIAAAAIITLGLQTYPPQLLL